MLRHREAQSAAAIQTGLPRFARNDDERKHVERRGGLHNASPEPFVWDASDRCDVRNLAGAKQALGSVR